MKNTQKIQNSRNRIIKIALKIAEYEASGVENPMLRKELDFLFNNSILLYDTQRFLEESKPFMDKIKCQNSQNTPIPKPSETTTFSTLGAQL